MKREYSDIILKRILELCNKRKITLNKLATMSGVSQSTLHKIAIAFNMTLAEFLDYPELNNYSFEDENDE